MKHLSSFITSQVHILSKGFLMQYLSLQVDCFFFTHLLFLEHNPSLGHLLHSFFLHKESFLASHLQTKLFGSLLHSFFLQSQPSFFLQKGSFFTLLQYLMQIGFLLPVGHRGTCLDGGLRFDLISIFETT